MAWCSAVRVGHELTRSTQIFASKQSQSVIVSNNWHWLIWNEWTFRCRMKSPMLLSFYPVQIGQSSSVESIQQRTSLALIACFNLVSFCCVSGAQIEKWTIGWRIRGVLTLVSTRWIWLECSCTGVSDVHAWNTCEDTIRTNTDDNSKSIRANCKCIYIQSTCKDVKNGEKLF